MITSSEWNEIVQWDSWLNKNLWLNGNSISEILTIGSTHHFLQIIYVLTIREWVEGLCQKLYIIHSE